MSVRKDAPLISERLVVDGGTKGVKNVLVYLNKPTSVSDEAKKAAAATNVVFDQNKCVFDPHVLASWPTRRSRSSRAIR